VPSDSGVKVAQSGIGGITTRSKSKITGVRITSKGQVTIPQTIREQFGLLPDTEVDFVVVKGVVTLVRGTAPQGDRGDRAVAGLRGSGRGGMTTDELLALTRD
jgi:AbrB family looped-hinge helix DNA binding protein